MPLPQRKFREIVFQMLYSHDLADPSTDDMIPFMMEEMAVSKKNMRHALARMEAIRACVEELDQQIAQWSEGYEVDRIQRVERNVLRLALYELLKDDAVPPKVAIAEGLRITKKFSTPEAVHFVNAVLDAAYRSTLEGEEEDKETQFFSEDQK